MPSDFQSTGLILTMWLKFPFTQHVNLDLRDWVIGSWSRPVCSEQRRCQCWVFDTSWNEVLGCFIGVCGNFGMFPVCHGLEPRAAHSHQVFGAYRGNAHWLLEEVAWRIWWWNCEPKDSQEMAQALQPRRDLSEGQTMPWSTKICLICWRNPECPGCDWSRQEVHCEE